MKNLNDLGKIIETQLGLIPFEIDKTEMFSADFRNKLTGILGFVELAKMYCLIENQAIIDSYNLISNYFYNGTPEKKSIFNRNIDEEDLELTKNFIDNIINYCRENC